MISCLACGAPGLARTDWCAPHAGTVRTLKLTALVEDWLALRADHGLGAWSLRFDPTRAWLGRTYHARHTIVLARPWVGVRPLAASREVLRHEFAHALVGPGHGHDEVWAAQARALGCEPRVKAILDRELAGAAA